MTTSYLADEFLGESGTQTDKSNNPYLNSGFTSSNVGLSGKTSYLKTSNANNQGMKASGNSYDFLASNG